MNAQINQATKTMTTKMFLALSLLVGGCAVDADLDTTAHQIAGSPILLPSSGTGQDREVMSTFDPLVVTLSDTFGQPLSNATITFTAPLAGATSTFRFGGQVETDGEGRAEIRAYANQIAGTYTVWAHADGAAPMPFVLTNMAASPAHIEPVAGSNQGSMVGMPFHHPLTVEVFDNYGNAVEGAPVQFIAPTQAPSMMMNAGDTSITNSDGRASVVATAGTTAGTYTVTAKVTGAPSVTFTLVNMTERWVPTYEVLQDAQLDTNDSLDLAP